MRVLAVHTFFSPGQRLSKPWTECPDCRARTGCWNLLWHSSRRPWRSCVPSSGCAAHTLPAYLPAFPAVQLWQVSAAVLLAWLPSKPHSQASSHNSGVKKAEDAVERDKVGPGILASLTALHPAAAEHSFACSLLSALHDRASLSSICTSCKMLLSACAPSGVRAGSCAYACSNVNSHAWTFRRLVILLY